MQQSQVPNHCSQTATMRLLAFAIDLIPLFLAFVVNLYNIVVLQSVFMPIVLFSSLLGLKVIPEVIWNRSLGKWLLGLSVFSSHDDQVASKRQIYKRNILFILWCLFSLILGLLALKRESGTYIQAMIPSSGPMGIEELLAMVPVMLFFSQIVSLFCSLITPRNQTLVDLFSKTYCCRVRKK